MSGTIFATVERYPLLRDLSLTLDASALFSGGSVSSGSSSLSALAVLSGTIGVRDPVFGIMVGNDADAAVRLPVDPEAGILACTESCMFGPSGLAPWVLRVGLRERGTTRTVAVDMVMTSLVSGSVVDGVVVVEATLPVDVFRLADAGDPPAVWDVSFVTLASGAGRTVRGASNLAFYNLDSAVDLSLFGWEPYSYSVLSPVLDADPPALTTYVLSQEGVNARRFTLTLNVWDTSDNTAGGYLIFSSRTDGRLHQVFFSFFWLLGMMFVRLLWLWWGLGRRWEPRFNNHTTPPPPFPFSTYTDHVWPRRGLSLDHAPGGADAVPDRSRLWRRDGGGGSLGFGGASL